MIADLKPCAEYTELAAGMATCFAKSIEQGATHGLATYESLLAHLVQAEVGVPVLGSRFRPGTTAYGYISSRECAAAPEQECSEVRKVSDFVLRCTGQVLALL